MFTEAQMKECLVSRNSLMAVAMHMHFSDKNLYDAFSSSWLKRQVCVSTPMDKCITLILKPDLIYKT
jgi:hypothetical protein